MNAADFHLLLELSRLVSELCQTDEQRERLAAALEPYVGMAALEPYVGTAALEPHAGTAAPEPYVGTASLEPYAGMMTASVRQEPDPGDKASSL